MPSPSDSIILVIDDNPTICLLLRAGLTKQGYRTIEACGGQEGLAAFRSHDPDLVLIDVAMPNMDGFQVARMPVSEPMNRTMLLVMLTGSDDDETRRKAREAREVLTKPFQLISLAERLRQLLD